MFKFENDVRVFVVCNGGVIAPCLKQKKESVDFITHEDLILETKIDILRENSFGKQLSDAAEWKSAKLFHLGTIEAVQQVWVGDGRLVCRLYRC